MSQLIFAFQWCGVPARGLTRVALTGLTFHARILPGPRSQARFSPGYNLAGFQPSRDRELKQSCSYGDGTSPIQQNLLATLPPSRCGAYPWQIHNPQEGDKGRIATGSPANVVLPDHFKQRMNFRHSVKPKTIIHFPFRALL
jgi:hypothetical protein